MKRLAISCAVALSLFASSAAFGAPTWKERREAQQLAREGQTLLKKGEFDKAAEKYKAADELVPAPSYKYERAKLLVELGKFLEAAALLREAAEMKPQQWPEKQAQQKATKFLAEVEERTPKIEVKLFEPEAGKVRVRIDGEAYDPSSGLLHADPGEHEVTAEADGYERFEKKVTLTEQQEETVEITMKKAAVAAETPAEEAEEEGGGGISPIFAYVSWGVSAVGLGFGIGFGVAAIQTTNDVLEDYDCQDSKCPQDAEEDLDVAKLNGNISTAGFVIAGVGLAAGTILFFLADTGGDETDESEGALQIEASPVVGPGYFGVSGRF